MYQKIITIAATSLLCCVARANQPNAESPTTFAHVDPFSGESVMRLFGGLFIVLILVIALIWVLKRLQHLPAGVGGKIEILGTVALGQREKVVVVRLGEEQLVLGVTPGRIDRLHVLETPLEFAKCGGDQEKSFAKKFKQVLGQGERPCS